MTEISLTGMLNIILNKLDSFLSMYIVPVGGFFPNLVGCIIGIYLRVKNVLVKLI